MFLFLLFPNFPSSLHLSVPLFPGHILNFTPFSYLLFINVRTGKILLVFLNSSYPEKTREGCSIPPGFRGLIAFNVISSDFGTYSILLAK